jgi:hypothetical protein
MPWEIADVAERRAATDVATFSKGVSSLAFNFNGKCFYCEQPVETSALTRKRI